MKGICFVAAVSFALGAASLASPAAAKGCIKGAIVGGIAGSMVGHGKVGAAAGCAVGHHNAAKKDEANKAQQHHDRFFAAYNLLHDRPDLPAGIRAALRQRCLSAAWKAARAGLIQDGRLGILLGYAGARSGLLPASDRLVDRIAKTFATVSGVKRMSTDTEAATA